jgi:hypothetical protein
MIITSKKIDNKNTQILKIVKLEDTFFLVYQNSKPQIFTQRPFTC